MSSDHVRAGACFIEKDQLFGVEKGLLSAPQNASCGNIFTMLLGGEQSFF